MTNVTFVLTNVTFVTNSQYNVYLKVEREIDAFVVNVARQNVTNKNVELRGKNGFKLFPNGIAHIIRNGISVDGSFHIAMARHLHVYLCNLEHLPMDMQQTFGRAYELLFQVHTSLRLPVPKCELKKYQNTIDSLMVMLKMICRESSLSDCNSIKFHYPIHWGQTRSEFGCAADEKSLEKKLSESQKRHYSFPNGKCSVDTQMVSKIYI